LIEGLAAARDVSMADLHHQTRNPDHNAGIESGGIKPTKTLGSSAQSLAR